MGTSTHLDPEVTVALQGTLDTFALPDVLRLLAATKKTGRVHVTGPRGTGSVWVDDGAVGAIDAPNAPHATEPVDALFELLRFDQGSFTFDGEAAAGATQELVDVEVLLGAAESLLVEWREIESVVPSMDAWVTLRRELVAPTVTVDRAQWVTVVAVGSGSTVRGISDDLRLAELPVSRAVRDLVELGLVTIDLVAPAKHRSSRDADAPGGPPTPAAEDASAEQASGEQPSAEQPSAEPKHSVDAATPSVFDPDAPLPTARPLRARRARPAERVSTPTSPVAEAFVPLDLPGQGPAATYDPVVEPTELEDEAINADDDGELARQLASLSPRAAEAVRAAAEAATDEEREAALAAAEEREGRPINRGPLLKFLSSVKS